MNISTDLLYSLHNDLGHAILMLDEDFNPLMTTDPFKVLFHTQENESPGLEVVNMMAADPETCRKKNEKITEAKQNALRVIETKDGRWLEQTYRPVMLAGKFQCHAFSFEDITGRRKTEGMLMTMSNIQHTLLNGVNYSIVQTDLAGTIVSFNAGAEQMLGYKASELTGKKSVLSLHSPEELKLKAAQLSAELKREISPDFEAITVLARHGVVDTREWKYITAGGSTINVSLSVSSIRNAMSEVIGYLGIARDISEQKKAESLLKLSERRYQNIIENSTEIIYKTDRQGRFTFVNPVSQRITGFSEAELLNMGYLDLVRPDKRDEVRKFYEQQVEKKKASSYYEFPIITKTGSEAWIGQSVQITLKEDRTMELISLAIDISRQKDAEKKIIETNQELLLFKNLINNTTDAMQVATEHGELLYLNNEASSRLGIPPAEVTRYKVSDIDPVFSTRGKWEEHVAELKSQKFKTYDSINVQQGTLAEFPVEVVVRYIEINLMGYIISSARDITVRKNAEKILKAQEEKYRNIIENMKLGLLEVDLEENIQYFNEAFTSMAGFSEQDLIGKNAAELFARGEAKTVVAEKKQRRERGESDSYEVFVKNNKGEEKWWMISGAPNYNDEGQMIGSIGIHLDITDQKKLTQQLELARLKAEEATEAREAFLANMSHEIRTPLNGIIGMIRELSFEELNSKQKKYVNNASMASQHLLAVLNNILDISKIRAGELVLENHPFKLADTLKEVKQIMNASAREKGLILSLANHEVKEMVYQGDAFRIRQILLNLVGNSIKFTNTGGVYIECRVEEISDVDHRIIISVEDTGIGMEEEYLERIFKKFTQEDSSTSRKFGGSGLGMAITYELMQLMNGNIRVKSTKNTGTIVEIDFHLNIGQMAPGQAGKPQISPGMLAGRRILLVEDNDFNRAVARKTLERYKCEVEEAINGKVAVDMLMKDQQFDMVLMDLQMPEMDGIEAGKHIIEKLKIQIPIIALTANAFKSELELCRQVGFVDYITKPFQEDVMLNIIGQHLTLKVTPPADLQKQRLYDLKNLKTISGGDEGFVGDMIKLFIEQTTSTTLLMQQALTNKNYLLLSQLAHKIKPSIDNMGIVALKEKIRHLESRAKQQQNVEELPELFSGVNDILSQTVAQLREEITSK